jgi:hypothetical protein
MKLILGLAIAFLIAISLIADYKWRRWIASRKEDQDHDRRA